MNVLIKLSGSIACYKTCELISMLSKAGHAVQTVTTAAATRFIGAATLEGLTGRPNLSDLWETGDQMAHIRLPEWADCVVLCPATANTINKLALGMGDDLVSTLFLAHDFSKPYYIAPAMNPRMLSHPATRESLEKLQAWGATILPTGEGRLACGDFGFGKLLEPEAIFAAITAGARGGAATPCRVLITAGGTEEPIDSVRVLTNLSSGKTGAALAGAFARAGHEVTLLRSHRSEPSHWHAVREDTFRTVADLETRLREHLAGQPFDAVIHLAAVSDFAVAGAEPGAKLTSDAPVTLDLTPTPKLLPHLKRWATASEKEPLVVGFKLTDSLEGDAAAGQALAILQSDAVDAVVHNARESIAAAGASHPCRVYFPDGQTRETATKDELAAALLELLEHQGSLTRI